MTLALRYAVRSDVGLLREGNEDSAYAGPHLLAVADGMGGHAAGEVASSATIATIADLDTDQPARGVEQASAEHDVPGDDAVGDSDEGQGAGIVAAQAVDQRCHHAPVVAERLPVRVEHPGVIPGFLDPHVHAGGR